jgi:hypothetical protein
MKLICSLLLIAVVPSALAQKSVLSSNEFIVKGQVKQEVKFTLSDLSAFESKPIGDLVITNHTGVPHGTAKALKGILLKDLLAKIEINNESPKTLSEFYFTLVATDNYKVVFSWNEIFNSPTGDAIWLITEKGGVKIDTLDERILVVTTLDFKTGRRHVKGLSQILVNRVN